MLIFACWVTNGVALPFEERKSGLASKVEHRHDRGGRGRTQQRGTDHITQQEIYYTTQINSPETFFCIWGFGANSTWGCQDAQMLGKAARKVSLSHPSLCAPKRWERTRTWEQCPYMLANKAASLKTAQGVPSRTEILQNWFRNQFRNVMLLNSKFALQKLIPKQFL